MLLRFGSSCWIPGTCGSCTLRAMAAAWSRRADMPVAYASAGNTTTGLRRGSSHAGTAGTPPAPGLRGVRGAAGTGVSARSPGSVWITLLSALISAPTPSPIRRGATRRDSRCPEAYGASTNAGAPRLRPRSSIFRAHRRTPEPVPWLWLKCGCRAYFTWSAAPAMPNASTWPTCLQAHRRSGIRYRLRNIQPGCRASMAGMEWQGARAPSVARVGPRWRRHQQVLRSARGPQDLRQGLVRALRCHTGTRQVRGRRARRHVWLSYPFAECRIVDGREGIAPLLASIAGGRVASWLLYRVILPYADHVFVQSEQMKRDVAAHGIPAARMTAVPMAVSEDLLPEARHRAGHPPVPRHAHSCAPPGYPARGARAIVRDRHPAAQLVFVGDGDSPEDRAFLERRTGEFGSGPRYDSPAWCRWMRHTNACHARPCACRRSTPYFSRRRRPRSASTWLSAVPSSLRASRAESDHRRERRGLLSNGRRGFRRSDRPPAGRSAGRRMGEARTRLCTPPPHLSGW